MMRNTSAMAYGITTGLLLLLCVAPGTAAAQASAGSQQTPMSLPGTAIPVVEVATQATEVSKFLRTLSAQIISSPAIDTIHRVLPAASGTIDLELATTSTMLQGQPTLELLQAQQQLWQRRQLQTTGWLHVLTEQATHLQKVGHQLTALHTTWTATRTAAQQAQTPETILQQIDATLAAIAAAQTPLEVQRAAVLVASSLGYGRLARLVTSGILAGGTLALTLAASFRVLNGVLACALRLWPLQALHLVRHHRDYLERRLSRGLVWLAILGWVVRYLNYVGLLEPVLASGYTVLTAKLERGTISLSVGDVLAFGLTVVGAYLLSTFLRFVLDEDIYPRISITEGQSYAVSSLLHYSILTLGFIVGLGLLGMDLTRVTVLVGALGVGIGFGLQSVVNNFISGLILLFERPIHVGDVVELGAMQGVVRRIGIRASVVHTWQGADIIVPNSHLVTEQVINWTLTDQLRRIDLPVGVNYGVIPHQVIALLETVARAHPQVLPEPPPKAFFMGYGDSAINFTLFAWPDHFHHWQQVKSDLTAAVYEAVSAAGMRFHAPA